MGWEPIVFTPENPHFSLTDNALEQDISPNLEVIKFPIWEPFSVYEKLFSKSGKKLTQGIVIEKSDLSWKDKLSIWIRGNFFIPDPRKYWAKPASRFLESIIKDNAIDLVVTSGPPHSMHLVGRRVKKITGVTWVADFRDPWSDWDILDILKVSRPAMFFHKKLEQSVLKQADMILTTSSVLRDRFRFYAPTARVEKITNGVDEEDFEKIKYDSSDGKFRLVHLGLLNELRNPVLLWEVLEELCDEQEGFQSDLEVVLGGMVSGSILDFIQTKKNLSLCLKVIDYVSHQEAISWYNRASVQLLLLNQTEKANLTIPGKLFEYLYLGNPILALGPTENDTNRILLDSGNQGVVSHEDREAIKTSLLMRYENFKKGVHKSNKTNVQQFTRKHLTKVLAEHLNSLKS